MAWRRQTRLRLAAAAALVAGGPQAPCLRAPVPDIASAGSVHARVAGSIAARAAVPVHLVDLDCREKHKQAQANGESAQTETFSERLPPIDRQHHKGEIKADQAKDPHSKAKHRTYTNQSTGRFKKRKNNGSDERGFGRFREGGSVT